MIFTGIVVQFKDRMARRAEYRRLIADINALSLSDLVDMRADRSEMLHHAYREVYGDRAP